MRSSACGRLTRPSGSSATGRRARADAALRLPDMVDGGPSSRPCLKSRVTGRSCSARLVPFRPVSRLCLSSRPSSPLFRPTVWLTMIRPSSTSDRFIPPSMRRPVRFDPRQSRPSRAPALSVVRSHGGQDSVGHPRPCVLARARRVPKEVRELQDVGHVIPSSPGWQELSTPSPPSFSRKRPPPAARPFGGATCPTPMGTIASRVTRPSDRRRGSSPWREGKGLTGLRSGHALWDDRTGNLNKAVKRC